MNAPTAAAGVARRSRFQPNPVSHAIVPARSRSAEWATKCSGAPAITEEEFMRLRQSQIKPGVTVIHRVKFCAKCA